MDLTGIETCHQVGEYVRIDFGDMQRGKPDYDGESGVVIDHDYHDFAAGRALSPTTGKSMNIIRLKGGRIVRAHWMNCYRLSALESLAKAADED